MDQVRTALAWLKKQHFWVLSGLVALIALFCWWSASRKLSALFTTNKATITKEFDNLKGVRSTPFHPNQAIIERQDAEKKKQEESVTKVWQQLFDRQREAVLKWPPELKPDFATTVEKMQFNDDIPLEMRNRYQNYIDRHFPELPKQINARPLEATTTGGPGGVPGGGAFGRGGGGRYGEGEAAPGMPLGPGVEDNDYICEWVDSDQAIIRDKLNFPERPSSLRIWATQEDLWVYHTLLDAIAKTNQAANATRMSNAAVKVVYSLEVGQAAAASNRQENRLAFHPPAAVAAAGAEGGAPGAPGLPGRGPEGPGPRGSQMMGEGGRGGGGPGSTGPMTPAQEQEMLLSGRYLDDKGLPIPVGAGAAGGAEGGPPPAPDPAAVATPAPPLDMSLFGVGFKRLPVRMVLQIDSRWLPYLITTCANEPLRVEVQQVRVNPPDLAGMSGGAGGGGGGGGRFSGFGEGSRGGGGMNSGSGPPLPDHSGLQYFPAQPNVVNVVIQGTIYIFNKPNTNLLQGSAGAGVAGNP